MDFSKYRFLRYIKARYLKLAPNRFVKSAPAQNYIFVHINKTGGTSILKSLNHPKKLHFTAKEIIAKIGRKEWDNSYSFAFVRNPFDRVVSQYKYRIKTNQNDLGDRPISFSEWVGKVYGPKPDLFYRDTERMFITQKKWLTDDKGKISVNYIGYFENLSRDFQRLRNKLDIEAELGHRNRTKRKKDYWEYYDEKSYLTIKNYFKEDLDYFDYSFPVKISSLKS